MISRILTAAAIAAVAFGFSNSSAFADMPNPNNNGQGVLSQFQVTDDLLNQVANQALSESLRNIEADLSRFGNVHEVDVNLLNNGQPAVGGTGS
ncbi:hypothetical protein [Nonomuraea sp. NPDC049480]|uniref:hypothetical protein n=1 Tax=Nonomuraea sp. NPDC049480 TaxID=3364353 RepID=UPI0037B0910F